MYMVTIETEPEFSPGEPTLLFEEHYVRLSPRAYDVAADGRFLMIREENYKNSDFVLVDNWVSTLSTLVDSH